MYRRGISTRSSSRRRTSRLELGRRPNGRGSWTAGQIAEVSLGEIEGAFGLDVACQRQRRIRRVIVGPEERLDVLEAHRAEIIGRPDRRPVVGMLLRKQRRDNRHEREPVRAVLVVLPPLVEHDVALGLESLRRHRRQQISHPIRFHPERQVDCARRHHFPVVGAIGVRRSVQQPARALDRRKVAGVVVRRPLEHQVLEEMRKAGAARALVLRTDVVPDVYGNDRDVVILVNDDVEAVGERAFGVGERRVFHLLASYPERRRLISLDRPNRSGIDS